MLEFNRHEDGLLEFVGDLAMDDESSDLRLDLRNPFEKAGALSRGASFFARRLVGQDYDTTEAVSHGTPSPSPSPEIGRSEISDSDGTDLAEEVTNFCQGQAGGTGIRQRWVAFQRGRLERNQSRNRLSFGGRSTGSNSPVSGTDLEKSATSESDINLRDAGVSIRGLLLHVKGWWRKGPKLGERVAEIRKHGQYDQLIWWRLTKENVIDESKVRSVENLRGSIAEAVELTKHPGLYCFRFYPLPGMYHEIVDFAAYSEAERAMWLGKIQAASEHKMELGCALAGNLVVTVTGVNLQNEPAGFRRQVGQPQDVFLIVRCCGMSSRSAPRKWQPVAEGSFELCSPEDFNFTVDFPISDDDPDSLTTFEVWMTEKGLKSKLLGRIDIPLYSFHRCRDQNLHVPLRDPEIRGVESHIGSIAICGKFEQPVSSLLVPRPPMMRNKPRTTIGDKSLREHIRAVQDFLEEFEVFSKRFMYHTEMWRDIGFRFRYLVEWDSPCLTLSVLVILTLVIGFVHEYSLPLGVFVLLCVAIWQHPFTLQVRSGAFDLTSKADEVGKMISRCFLLKRLPLCQRTPMSGNANDTTKEVLVSNDGSVFTAYLERYENERRTLWGKFGSRSLRFFRDPGSWSTAEGLRAEAPHSVEQGVVFVWHVDVNGSTDSEGWQYSKNFGRGAVWRHAFNHTLYVRRRRHVGRPVLAGRQGGGATIDSTSPPVEEEETTEDGLGSKSSTRPLLPRANSRQSLNSAFSQPSVLTQMNQSTQHGSKGNAPEFGIARTPYHDFYQQYLLRWAVLQGHIEYWMDWYERRKNLILGCSLDAQNFAVLGISVLLIAAILLPTRILVLVWIYSFFYEGLSQGQLMRKNASTFIKALKDTAVTLWLDSDAARKRANVWVPQTPLNELTDAGVQLLVLREWIQTEFFDGRPMQPLRTIQKCATLGGLAQQVTWTSDRFLRRRVRERVWWRSTFRNLLDHVRSDVTLFQPMTCSG